ncbi:hypothetical protein GCM10011297_21490 [Bacterioplanes sanyensis]|nr:hypothetical protein GCM10011297_21490 [Bacterioplanes sanyensis]
MPKKKYAYSFGCLSLKVEGVRASGGERHCNEAVKERKEFLDKK